MPATERQVAARSFLPAELTSFVGRRSEITETRRLLGTAHLVTLTGPGGVGKTRLALRVASGLHRSFPDGVRLVELADLRDPTLLATTIADRLGVRDRSSRQPVDALVDHLGSRRVLLVLDNCEHLVDSCAHVVDLLLRACPNLRILATSRQSLGVCGEATLPVPPLPVPDITGVTGNANNGPNGTGQSGNGSSFRSGNGGQRGNQAGLTGLSKASLQHFDAVQMFLDRAQAVLPGFHLDDRNAARVVRLCQALDGIPLAIELATVRLRVLSLDELEERLDDRYRLLTSGSRNAPPRQQTLRAAIDWSYELCSPAEQVMWARLSVFSGGFDLEAAEQVCAGDGLDGNIDRAGVLDVIDALVDKSVVVHEEVAGRARYKLLETIREYGHEKLADAGCVAELRRRHRDWYDGLTEGFEREWLGPDQIAWISRLRREHANLRVALDHCATTPGEARTGLRIAIRLDDYWGILGLHTEARHWLDGALAAAPEPTAERVSALRMSGWFALLQGDEEQGRRLLDAAAALAEETGDRPEAAYVQHAYGMAALFSGDLDTAQVLMDRALQGFRHAKVLRGELFSLFIGALAHGGNGQPQRGLAMIDECLELSNRHQEVFWRSYALWGLAYLIVITTGDYDRAAAAAQEAVRYKRQLYDHLGLAFAVDTLAWVAERRGQHKRAAVLFGVAHTIWEGLGASPANYPVFAELHDKHARLTRSTLGDAAYEAAFQDGAAMSSEVALDYALEEGTADGPEPAAPAPPRAVGSLTRREREIAELIARGMTNREIAQTLVIAVRTAEGHVEHILSKLGFSSRAQVAAWVTGQRLRDRAPST